MEIEREGNNIIKITMSALDCCVLINELPIYDNSAVLIFPSIITLDLKFQEIPMKEEWKAYIVPQEELPDLIKKLGMIHAVFER